MVSLTVIAIFFGCLVSTAALTPLVMRVARRVGAVDRGGFRRVFQGEMPLLGGLAVAVPVLLLCTMFGVLGSVIIRNWQWVWTFHRPHFDFLMDLTTARADYAVFAIGGIAIVLLGVVDDITEMAARWKLVGQIVVALFVCFAGGLLTTVTVPFLGTITFGPATGTLLTVLWIVGLINAFNLIDGIDGLASGMALIGAIALVSLGFIQSNLFVMFVGTAIAGGLAAFLLFNFPPAKIFLGDTGSMFLGYCMAVMSLTGSQKSETAVIILAPILALSLPIFETLVSIVRRYVQGVPLFVGDKYHTHHRLLGKGYSQPRVVLTLYGVGLLFTVAAILSALIPPDSGWSSLPYGLYTATLFAIAWLAGYLRPKRVRELLERRERNRALQSLIRFVKCRLNGKPGLVRPALLIELCREEMGLRYLELRTLDGDAPIGASGAKMPKATGDFEETLRVTSLDGQDLLICYGFVCATDDDRRQDVSACLARVFDGVRLGRLRSQNNEID